VPHSAVTVKLSSASHQATYCCRLPTAALFVHLSPAFQRRWERAPPRPATMLLLAANGTSLHCALVLFRRRRERVPPRPATWMRMWAGPRLGVPPTMRTRSWWAGGCCAGVAEWAARAVSDVSVICSFSQPPATLKCARFQMGVLLLPPLASPDAGGQQGRDRTAGGGAPGCHTWQAAQRAGRGRGKAPRGG